MLIIERSLYDVLFVVMLLKYILRLHHIGFLLKRFILDLESTENNQVADAALLEEFNLFS